MIITIKVLFPYFLFHTPCFNLIRFTSSQTGDWCSWWRTSQLARECWWTVRLASQQHKGKVKKRKWHVKEISHWSKRCLWFHSATITADHIYWWVFSASYRENKNILTLKESHVWQNVSLLQVHVEQELLIYEAFPYDQQQPQNNLKVRFKKVSPQTNKGILNQDEFERSESLLCYFPSAQVPHNINFREKKSKLKKDKKSESGATEESAAAKSRIARFRYFEDISGYSGVRNFFLYTDIRT